MNLLDTLLELLPLDDLPRTGWVLKGVPHAESVAGHILGTSHLILALAPRTTPPIDLGAALSMALVHDLPEARTGDLPRPAGHYLPPQAKALMEDRIAEHLVAPLSDVAAEAWVGYRAGSSREARFVALCDKLQMGVRLLGYERSGQRGLGEFHASLRELDCSEFQPVLDLQRAILERLEG